MPATRTRQFAFVHIAVAGLAGFPVPELFNIDYAQVDVAARAIAENADFVLGVKVRMSENVIARHGLEPLQARDRGVREVGRAAKVMCHIGGVQIARADVADPRPAAPRRRADALLFRRTQRRRRGDQHRAGRQAAAGRAGSQAPRRGVRRRPRRWQLRLHDRRGGDPAGLPARHDLVGHPRVLRQHAGHAVPAVGDEQVPRPGLHARAGGHDGHGQRRRA